MVSDTLLQQVKSCSFQPSIVYFNPRDFKGWRKRNQARITILRMFIRKHIKQR